jgi:hypothetical protein
MTLVSPPASAFCPLVDQVSAQQLVLYNFQIPGPVQSPPNSVWAFNGQVWSEIANPNLADRLNPLLAYDGISSVLLYGGSQAHSPVANPELFNGSSWTAQTSILIPSPRTQMLGCLISGAGEIVMWAGVHINQALEETWVYASSSQTWTALPLTAAQQPPWRTQCPMASNGSVAILFSGWSQGEAEINESGIWVFQAGEWEFMATTNTPPARAGHGLVYDANKGQFLLAFGYNSAGTFFNDIWELTFSTLTWRHLGSTLIPSPRAGVSMCYMSETQQTVLWGGKDANGNLLSDTFVWNGFVWTPVPNIL